MKKLLTVVMMMMIMATTLVAYSPKRDKAVNVKYTIEKEYLFTQIDKYLYDDDGMMTGLKRTVLRCSDYNPNSKINPVKARSFRQIFKDYIKTRDTEMFSIIEDLENKKSLSSIMAALNNVPKVDFTGRNDYTLVNQLNTDKSLLLVENAKDLETLLNKIYDNIVDYIYENESDTIAIYE